MQIHVKWRVLGAVLCTGINGGIVLLTNEISRFSLIFCHQALGRYTGALRYAAYCLTMRLNIAFGVSLLFYYAQPGNDSVGFGSNAVTVPHVSVKLLLNLRKEYQV